jgi:hypothetical protein
MLSPVIPVADAANRDSDLQLASTLMSPVEHSYKHRQRAGPQKKGSGMFLPVIPVFDASNSLSDLQLAKTAMSPVEDSRKRRQRTPQKKCARIFLTGDLVAA